MRIATLLVLLLVGCRSPAMKESELLTRIDHLVYATPDVASTVDELEELLGVRAVPGGQHLGLGTYNALLSLGPTTYLEIIGPDPRQPAPDGPRIFGIDDLQAPRLATWVANAEDVDAVVTLGSDHEIPLGEASDGSRHKPDGGVLSWRATDPHAVIFEGLVPFFIQWKDDSLHPAGTSPSGCVLLALRASHPEVDAVTRSLTSLELPMPVEEGERALVATLQTPRGIVQLR